MKLIHVKDQQEKSFIPGVNGITVSVMSLDVQKQWNDLQRLVEQIAKEDFEGIILSANLGNTINYWGLEFCIRLRLSYSTIGAKSFATLFVYSENAVEEIVKEQIEQSTQPTGLILLTKGTFVFNNFDLFEIISTSSKNYNLLNEGNYKKVFWDIIKVNRPPELGHHSLANLLGAIRMAEITGNTAVLSSNQAIINKKTDLYLKYKTAPNLNDSKGYPKKVIPSKGKNILLIDDKENFGWSDLLKEIFEGSSFDFVQSGENFVARAEKKIFEDLNTLPKWDLILLDLRLEEKEDADELVNKHAQKYSGAKLLMKIKKHNQGVQVIIFTASNKAWNLKQLTDLGADGYFIKESAELRLIDEFSLKNFEDFSEQVQLCYKYSFLKLFFSKLFQAQIALSPRVDKKAQFPLPESFVTEYLKWIKLGNDNLSINKNELGLTTSFILYFSVLENISNRLIDTDNPFKNGKDGNGNQLFYFEFRTEARKIAFFEEKPKGSGNYSKTPFSSFPRSIPWQQKILNTFDFMSSYKIDMNKINRLLRKRHEIIHANVTTGNKIKVEKEDVVDLFNLITTNINDIR